MTSISRRCGASSPHMSLPASGTSPSRASTSFVSSSTPVPLPPLFPHLQKLHHDRSCNQGRGSSIGLCSCTLITSKGGLSCLKPSSRLLTSTLSRPHVLGSLDTSPQQRSSRAKPALRVGRPRRAYDTRSRRSYGLCRWRSTSIPTLLRTSSKSFTWSLTLKQRRRSL